MVDAVNVRFADSNSHKPEWFKIRPPSEKYEDIKATIKKYGLTTICVEGKCPNLSECWSGGTATFMVLGDTCTRGCRFCNVKTAVQGQILDKDEPKKLVSALKEMSELQEKNVFDYIVITSVDRDDLPDQGSNHFAECIRAVKKEFPEMIVEVLIPDFRGDVSLLKNVVDAKPDVISHNVETVERLQRPVRDIRANYKQSLAILAAVKKLNPNIVTKSAIMVGLGEKKEEVLQTMKDLRAIGVEIFTIGQYLRPTQRHLKIEEWVHPSVFEEYRKLGEEQGFVGVFSGPFVRSSYKAGEVFIKNFLRKK
jgi:lipoic acid synthetase